MTYLHAFKERTMNLISFSPLTLILLSIVKRYVNSHNIHIMRKNHRYVTPYNFVSLRNERTPLLTRMCHINNKWVDCTAPVTLLNAPATESHEWLIKQLYSAPKLYPGIMPRLPNQPLMYRRLLSPEKYLNILNLLPNHGKLAEGNKSPDISKIDIENSKSQLNLKLGNLVQPPSVTVHSSTKPPTIKTSYSSNLEDNFTTVAITPESAPLAATTVFDMKPVNPKDKDKTIFDKFAQALDNLQRKFFSTTFNMLSSISPAERQENGMSFVQSGLFLDMVLMALSTEVNTDTKTEIDDCLDLHIPDLDKIELIRQIVSSLPNSSDDLRFRWSSRLALWPNNGISQSFREGAASALNLQLNEFSGDETPVALARTLNEMVEKDSGGAIHDTFEEEELSDGVEAVVLTTVYLRGRWRAAPTVLNGTRPFRDAEPAPQRNTRMIRINDIMRYADLPEWDAEAIEIFYATPGLSLLLLMPRGRSLRSLVGHVAETSLQNITERMYSLRVATSMPLYTLRMTLLLPNKLRAMGINQLVNVSAATSDSLRLSHAVQRLMFWAEAGRNAFKDDGIEWDESPELELVVDRPYIFFVRWNNITLMNGNFVL